MNLSHLLKVTDSNTGLSAYIDADSVKNITPGEKNGETYTYIVDHNNIYHRVKESPDEIYNMMKNVDSNWFEKVMDFLRL